MHVGGTIKGNDKGNGRIYWGDCTTKRDEVPGGVDVFSVLQPDDRQRYDHPARRFYCPPTPQRYLKRYL